MSVLATTLDVHLGPATLVALVLVAVAAGILGALTGIGGGTVIVPALVFGWGVDFRAAVAVSLAAVVANSVIAASSYLRQGLAHKRLAMALETATTAGGITGGLVTAALPRWLLEALFAAAMFVSGAATRWRARRAVAVRPVDDGPGARDRTAANAAALTAAGVRAMEGRSALVGTLEADRTAADGGAAIRYQAHGRPVGLGASYVAGAMSGLLGIGGGFLKVPAMTLGMGIPVRIATATSPFMIGVTAVASLVVYYADGRVFPLLMAPIVLGTAVGSFAGARVAARVTVARIEGLYVSVVGIVGVLFVLRAAGVL